MEGKVVHLPDYCAQPNFTYRFGLVLETLGRIPEAIQYLKMTLDDWGGFCQSEEFDMAQRIAPHFIKMYQKMY